MANPRDLAEQAIALLQSALSDSEARASELDEQLKRKRQPKNRLEEQLDVLTHRLENVEAERIQWEQKAGHLEEVAEAERVKVAQLKKKLEIAESGPEKLTKKEINFWRAKAEAIDAEITDYKNRLAALRRELNERDEAITRLETAKGTTPTGEHAAEPDTTLELRRQLEQRDRWLADLRLELHELKAEPTAPLETDAEMETLRARIRGLEQSLGTATNARAGLEADLARAQFELAARERALHETAALAERQLAEHDRTLREAAAAAERDRTALAEREHRLVELSAEVEHLRNDLRTRMEQQRGESLRQAEQAAQSEREAEALRTRLDQDRQEAAAAHAELQGKFIEREREIEKQRQLLAANDTDFRELRAQLAQRETDLHEHRRQLADREQSLAVARRQLESHGTELEQREREIADRSEQLRALTQRLSDRDGESEAAAAEFAQVRAAAAESSRELGELRATLAAQTDELAETRIALSERESALDAARAALAARQSDLDEARAALAARERDLDEAFATAQSNTQELERARATLIANEREVGSLRDTLLTSSRELDVLRADNRRLDTELAAAAARVESAAGEVAAAREQIAGLETELKDEREHAESLSELANERRDHMTKLQEQVEEAEERFAEASWKLGKSQHFQRIVKRRRGLVVKLLDALRAKMKANTALKAGLDGLRKYKANAEENQQKLLQRTDQLQAELSEAEDELKRYQSGTAGKEELAQALARATALEERLSTQAELIQTLEGDLKAARLGQKAAAAAHQGAEDKHPELEQLRKELETKNQIIAKLQTDTDEQQRKLSKLRGSESETVRLRALTEKDRSEIEILQRAAKEHEATIKKLTESAESWKRKYQFLAQDSPEAYKNGEK